MSEGAFDLFFIRYSQVWRNSHLQLKENNGAHE